MANEKKESGILSKNDLTEKDVPQIVGAEKQVIVEHVRPTGKRYISNQWTYQIPSLPIPAGNIKETFNTDVVVIGAGTSGKAAALSAAQAGAKVIQIDRHVTFRWGGGHIAAIDSPVQKRLGVEVNKDDVCLELMKWAGNKPDQRLYRLWADNSGAVLAWLKGMTDPAGLEMRMAEWPPPLGYNYKTEYYPTFSVCHFITDGKSLTLNHGLTLTCIQNNAVKLGVDIRYQTRAVQLIRQPNGRVTGVIARDKAGNYIQFNARKAVVLCTGDYSNNPWMMAQYCSVAVDVARTSSIYMTRNEDLLNAPEPLNVGDGHQMAMQIGAVMEPGPHAPMAHASVGISGANAFLRVNTLGERYENEDVPAQSQANSLVRQPGKMVWQVFDSKWDTEITKMGMGLGTFNKASDMLRARIEQNAVKADTLEELARKMDIPSKTFKANVGRINELARKGKDLDYGKRPDRLTTVDRPPFYAGQIKQEILVVMGGLNTNIKMQPLDKERKVIPGLYLAGNTVGNRFAVDYPTMCPGLSHSMAWTTGRLAGLSAAAEKV